MGEKKNHGSYKNTTITIDSVSAKAETCLTWNYSPSSCNSILVDFTNYFFSRDNIGFILSNFNLKSRALSSNSIVSFLLKFLK